MMNWTVRWSPNLFIYLFKVRVVMSERHNAKHSPTKHKKNMLHVASSIMGMKFMELKISVEDNMVVQWHELMSYCSRVLTRS